VLSLLLAATAWGVVWYPLRLLEEAGLAGLWSAFIAYSPLCVLGFGLLIARRGELATFPLSIAVMALGAGWCNVAFILAVLDGNVVRVLLLFYLSPVWTVVLGWWLLAERLTPAALLVLVVAMGGALVMLWDPAIGLPWPGATSDWLALSAGLGFALANVMARRLSGVSVAVKTVADWLGVWLVGGAGLLLLAPGLPLVGPQPLLGAVTLGLLGFGLMTLTTVYGVSRMPVHRSAIILLFELVAGAVSAEWLTDEVVRLEEWIGGALIVAAAYWAARQEEERI
jgi:drug/metabolite transporter (DMT)-like permease